MVFNILSNFSKDFENPDIINLMIIVDNLGWKYTGTLKELFQHEGFAVTRIEPYLSMLPSLTEISKKCLLSGNPTYSEIDNTQYTAIVEKGWVPYFNDSKFLYLPDINTLLTLPNIECQTYIVNYLPIDKTLHQPESTLGLPHDVHIKTLLERLVDMVLEFINKHNLKDKITIHITSDHCSTKIPQTLKNQIDTSFFKSADFEHITPRLVAVKTERFDNLPDNLKEDCFFLDQGKFGNDRYYLSARRSNRFSKLDNNCYVHGGISPEEVIVPYMAVQKIISTIKDLTIVLIKTTYRYKLETIELEIANPNESSAENITVEIINSNIESEVYPLDWLEGKRKTSAAIQARFKKTQSQDDSKYLNISLTFESNGERHQCEPIKLPITMKSMFEIKDKTIFDGLD